MLTLAAAAATAQTTEHIRVALDLPAVAWTQAGDGEVEVSAGDYRTTAQPARPRLPEQVFTYALPPDADPQSVVVAIENAEYSDEVLPGLVRAGAPLRISSAPEVASYGSVQRVVDGRDADVYGQDAWYPAAPASLAGVPRLRKWNLAQVRVAPAQYRPAQGLLRVLRRVEFDLRYHRTDRKLQAAADRDTIMDDVALARVANADDARAWYALGRKAAVSGTTGYVILTTDAIYDTTPTLYGLVTHKQAKGFTVHVVTETRVDGSAAATGWNEVTGQAPDGKADRIRKWLQNNYAALDIKYLLLVGNPDPDTGDLPMKRCYSYVGESYDYPADSYYADLTGNWDLNGDGIFGTGADDGPGGVDFMPEVYVGRLPVYLVAGWQAALEKIVGKIIRYETEADIGWRHTALLPESFSDAYTDGAYLSESMKNNYLAGAGYTAYTMYQQGAAPGYPEYDSVFASDEELRDARVVNRWKNNAYGLVLWWAHGWSQGAAIYYDGTLFQSDHCALLNDARPAAVFMVSCTCGNPAYSDNLGFSTLKNGGIASVAAANVSWYYYCSWSTNDANGMNASMGYEFMHRAVAGHQPFGDALHGLKAEVDGWRNNLLTFNLYGDPSLSLASHADDTDHDGMPDAWETQYGLNPASAADAAGDLDGDALTNLREYQLGTNPRWADSDLDGMDDATDPQPGVAAFAQVTVGLRTNGYLRCGYMGALDWQSDRVQWGHESYSHYGWDEAGYAQFDVSSIPDGCRVRHVALVYQAADGLYGGTFGALQTTLVPLGALGPADTTLGDLYRAITNHPGLQVEPTNRFPVTGGRAQMLGLGAFTNDVWTRLPAHTWALGWGVRGGYPGNYFVLSNLAAVISYEPLSSAYASLSVAGTFNGWNAAANNMRLVDHYTWEWTATFTNQTGVEFKFAGNASWSSNWGEQSQGDFDLPIAGTAEFGNHPNIRINATLNGRYRFRFNESTGAYSVEFMPLDSDGDGMPDAWETAHSLNPYDGADAAQDPDHDGRTNLQECQRDTDPHVWTAFLSAYAFLSVPGVFNGWNAAASNMCLVDDYTWRWDTTFSGEASTQFKFTANGSWDVNWGDGDQGQFVAPLSGTGGAGKGNIQLNGPLTGSFRFTFNEQTRAYSVTPVTTPDTDNDGMDDAWESAHGLNPRAAQDAWADDDGDGLPNKDEHEAHGDPRLRDTDGDGLDDLGESIAGTALDDRASVFRTASQAAPAQLTLRWPGAAGRLYDVYYRDGNPAGGAWTPWPGGAGLTGQNGEMTLVVTELPAGGARYYKVKARR